MQIICAFYKWEDSSLCEYTDINILDRTLDAKWSDFGLNYVSTGTKIQYSNGKEDRWFKFYCCPLKRIYPKRTAKTLT